MSSLLGVGFARAEHLGEPSHSRSDHTLAFHQSSEEPEKLGLLVEMDRSFECLI